MEYATRKMRRVPDRSIRSWLVRRLGTYRHSGWDGLIDYHIYRWRGRDYWIVCR